MAKEFPFLYAGTINLSTEYDIWIAPGTQKDVPDWKDAGYVIRIIDETTIEEEIRVETSNEKTRVLFIAPHLSTGGCPQYLLKKIQTYKDVLDIYVVEYQFLGADFVVQRNQILEIVGETKFFSLPEDDKGKLISIINDVKPEIVHFEEMPESYVDMELIDKIYNPLRTYFITETTHSSESNPVDKRFIPDKFIFCSKYSQEKFKEIEIPSEVWEYPIEDFKRPNRFNALRKLKLDPEYVHILNVGLFTSGKNQGEIFEIARKFLGEKIMFHFVGNQAGNFEHYWKPIMKNKPENCKIWGERKDVENFLSACDIFYFSSIFELNPLVVKEALSWKMPVLMYNLHTYLGTYSKEKNVHFLNPQKNLVENEKILRKIIENLIIPVDRTWLNKCKIVHIVSEIFNEMEQNSIASVSELAMVTNDIDYTIHYNPPARIIPHDKPPMFENAELKPGHYGCFEAFRKAIAEDFTDEYDFVIICERDCKLERSPEDIISLLKKTFKLMEDEDITYFTFGDKVDLDKCYLQSEKIKDLPGDFGYLTNKIIGLQFIIFSKSGRDFLREQFKTNNWYGMDIWLNEIYNKNNKKMGILNERVTTQFDGYSLIDAVEKTFQANKK
jgi:hypothetical protein